MSKGRLLPPLLNIKLAGLDRQYCHLKSSPTGIEAVDTKRDRGAAFARCSLRPDSAGLIGAEVSLANPPGGNLIGFYMVLPFGFAGSSVISGRLIQASHCFRQFHTPARPAQERYRASSSGSVCGRRHVSGVKDRWPSSDFSRDFGVRVWLFIRVTVDIAKKLTLEVQGPAELLLLFPT